MPESYYKIRTIKTQAPDFPGSLGLGISLPTRRHRFNPWFGKIPHAPGQLSLCATMTEPVRALPQEKPPHREALTLQGVAPLAPTRDSPHTATKTQHSQNKLGGKKKHVLKGWDLGVVSWRGVGVLSLSYLTDVTKLRWRRLGENTHNVPLGPSRQRPHAEKIPAKQRRGATTQNGCVGNA